jgi:hypothetical protein
VFAQQRDGGQGKPASNRLDENDPQISEGTDLVPTHDDLIIQYGTRVISKITPVFDTVRTLSIQ